MQRGVRIIVEGKFYENEFPFFIKESAEKLRLAGSVQALKGDTVLIYVLGDNESIEALIDKMYEGFGKAEVEDIKVSPMDTGRQFRGVFRVITN